MTTKAKAARPLTPKQANIKATSLIRGIDNSVARIRKETASIADATSQLKKTVLPALSNTEAKAKAPAKKAKEKAKAPAKKAKAPAKKAKEKKTPAQSPSKAAQKAKPPVEGRPTIKEAIQETIGAQGPISPADLWKKVVEKYGYWSRQSLYNALKDTKLFKKADGVVGLVPATGSKKKDNVDSFVDDVVKDKSVADTV
jgi:hypothetical protein